MAGAEPVNNGDKGKGLDAGWDELLGDEAAAPAAPVLPDDTQPWTEDVRAANKRRADAKSKAKPPTSDAEAPSQDEGEDDTQPWTEDVRAASMQATRVKKAAPSKPGQPVDLTVPKPPEIKDPDKQMDRLMSEDAEASQSRMKLLTSASGSRWDRADEAMAALGRARGDADEDSHDSQDDLDEAAAKDADSEDADHDSQDELEETAAKEADGESVDESESPSADEDDDEQQAAQDGKADDDERQAAQDDGDDKQADDDEQEADEAKSTETRGGDDAADSDGGTEDEPSGERVASRMPPPTARPSTGAPRRSPTMLYAAGLATVAVVGVLLWSLGDDKNPSDGAGATPSTREAEQASRRPGSEVGGPDRADPAASLDRPAPRLAAAAPADRADDEPALDEAQQAGDAAGQPDADGAADGAEPEESEDGTEAGSSANEITDGEADPVSGGEDPRAVPAGTSPEAAEAFSRLPVGASDKPPIGGIGKSGVHLDRMSIGVKYSRAGCGGKTSGFSVEARERVNVCLRVVHPREEEEVIVLWQKDGKTVRRTKVSVPNTHAYRTRAYLLLRNEYVGPWTVRVVSEDGTELAASTFEVVP